MPLAGAFEAAVFGPVTRPAYGQPVASQVRPRSARQGARQGLTTPDAAIVARSARRPGLRGHDPEIRFSPLPPAGGGGGRPQEGLPLKIQRGHRVVPPTARPPGRPSPGAASSASCASRASAVSPGVPGGRLVDAPTLALRLGGLRARNSAPSQPKDLDPPPLRGPPGGGNHARPAPASCLASPGASWPRPRRPWTGPDLGKRCGQLQQFQI